MMKLCRWRYKHTLSDAILISDYMSEAQARKAFGPLLRGAVEPCMWCRENGTH